LDCGDNDRAFTEARARRAQNGTSCRARVGQLLRIRMSPHSWQLCVVCSSSAPPFTTGSSVRRPGHSTSTPGSPNPELPLGVTW